MQNCKAGNWLHYWPTYTQETYHMDHIMSVGDSASRERARNR